MAASAESPWQLALSPTRETAARLRAFLIDSAANAANDFEPVAPEDVVVECVRDVVFAVRFPRRLALSAKQFWQHSGEIVTSRHAELVLQLLRDDTSSTSTASTSTTAANTTTDTNPTVQELLRMGDTETHEALRARIASLYPSGPSPDDVHVYPTGMAAIFASVRLLSRLRPGAPSVLVGFPYVDTLKILSRTEWCAGGVHFFPTCGAAELAQIEALLAREPVLGVFAEFPGNPLLSAPDLDTLARLAHANGAPLVVDDTVGSYNVDVARVADVVTTSLSKIFSGSCTVMGGSLVLSPGAPLYAPLRALLAPSDAFAAAADARALLADSRDVLARLARVNAGAGALARRLAAHRLVRRVHYPALSAARARFAALLARPEGGDDQFGPLLSLELRGGARAAAAFYDALDVRKGPSLGTDFTLCCPYTLLAHYAELAFAEACGVDRHLLRVSVGLEDANALWRVFERALEAAAAVTPEAEAEKGAETEAE